MATSTLGNGTLVLAGTTSGTTTVTATAVAGTTTLTLPAATDTLVGKATTDTLTNKTLTGAAMNGTLGATTPSTGAFTTLSATGNMGLSGATVSTGTVSLTFPNNYYAAWYDSGTSGGTQVFIRGTSAVMEYGAASYSWTTSGTKMTLDASGNLLVGTTSAVLSGKITTSFAGNVINGATFDDTGNGNGAGFIIFSESGTAIGSVSRVASTSAVAYNTTSDYRLKTVTGSVTGQGSRIDALKPIDYLWKDGGQQARGFLAHEFQTVYPNSVTGEKDAVDADGNPKHQSMQAATSEVIADLVAEIQSLRKRLAALESA